MVSDWEIILLCLNKTSFTKIINDMIILNILLCAAFFIGNKLSNSDIVELKSKFWQYMSKTFLYMTVIGLTYTLCKLLIFVPFHLLFLILLLITVFIIWCQDLKSYKIILYYKYLIR